MNKIILLSLIVAACGDVSRPDPDLGEVSPPESVSVVPDDSVVEVAEDGTVVVEPVPEFCEPGDACDIAGDPVKARLVDPTKSTINMRPDNKLFAPGDSVSFDLCAKTAEGAPVVGLPAIAKVKATRRQIAGDGTTLTGPDGCVTVGGRVVEADMIGDPATEEPDSGSYLVNGYIGGRLLNGVEILYDIW